MCIFHDSKIFKIFFVKIIIILISTIDKAHVSQCWDDDAKVDNQIPFVQKVNPDLDGYITHEAIEGLFRLVALEEKNWRWLCRLGVKYLSLCFRIFTALKGNSHQLEGRFVLKKVWLNTVLLSSE